MNRNRPKKRWIIFRQLPTGGFRIDDPKQARIVNDLGHPPDFTDDPDNPADDAPPIAGYLDGASWIGETIFDLTSGGYGVTFLPANPRRNGA